MTSHNAIPDAPVRGEMAARVEAKDWSKTVLGAAENWPSSLTLIVKLILASGFPMAVRWGPDFVMIYNDGYRAILGDKHPWALGLPFREVWPEVQPQLGPMHEAILAGKSGGLFAEDLLLKIQRRGAEWEDARFTISYSPVPDDTTATGVAGVLITAVETTNRVRMETALRASEERFAGIFRQTSVGVVQTDLDGQFLLANDRFCQITGRGEGELLSLRVSDITHPDDREDSVSRLKRLIANGIPFTVEKRYVRPDGSHVWASSNVALTRGPEGTPQNFVAVVQDITERKQSEHVLREREADLRLVLDTATDAFYCVGTDGTTIMCNAAFLRMLGIEREEDAIGKKLHDTIHHTHADGSHYPEEECRIYRTARGWGPAHVDNELFFRLDGTSFPAEYWVSPLFRDGALQGAVCTITDITERRLAQEQQSLLVRELNHRVKNLFAVTSSMIMMSARSARTPKELAANLRGRLTALSLAHELVLPNADEKPQSTSLETLLRQILAPYVESPDGVEQGRLVMSGPTVEVGARAVTSFALILHELATNAAKYGALSVPEGTVDIVWSTLGDVLFMKWAERGGPPVSGPPKAEGFGTLLSNHSVREQFQGALSYEWNSDGLVVDLSISVERLRHSMLAHPSTEDFHLLNRAPILIVEDEPYIALELQTSVEDAGGKVVGPAGTVSAALALLETSVVAAAILDVQLSDRDVTPVAEALIALRVPFVFHSGVGVPPDLQPRCRDAVVFKKPAAVERLLKTLAEIIAR
jgi:PAS domain S-box-containing protein